MIVELKVTVTPANPTFGGGASVTHNLAGPEQAAVDLLRTDFRGVSTDAVPILWSVLAPPDATTTTTPALPGPLASWTLANTAGGCALLGGDVKVTAIAFDKAQGTPGAGITEFYEKLQDAYLHGDFQLVAPWGKRFESECSDTFTVTGDPGDVLRLSTVYRIRGTGASICK